MNTISTSNSQVFLKDAYIIDLATPDAPHITLLEPLSSPTIDTHIDELNTQRQDTLL